MSEHKTHLPPELLQRVHAIQENKKRLELLVKAEEKKLEQLAQQVLLEGLKAFQWRVEPGTSWLQLVEGQEEGIFSDLIHDLNSLGYHDYLWLQLDAAV